MTLRRQIVDEEEDEEDEEEEAEVAEEEEEEDGHENVCHGCGSTGTLHCCSTCRHAYCDDCLTLGCRVGLDEPDWRCPVCTGVSTGRAIGIPQRGRALACGSIGRESGSEQNWRRRRAGQPSALSMHAISERASASCGCGRGV